MQIRGRRPILSSLDSITLSSLTVMKGEYTMFSKSTPPPPPPPPQESIYRGWTDEANEYHTRSSRTGGDDNGRASDGAELCVTLRWR